MVSRDAHPRQPAARGVWLQLTCGAVCAALVAAPVTEARADHDSVVTLGVGAGVGILRAAQPGQHSATSFVTQANLRLKLFGVLGVDGSYDLGHDGSLAAGDQVQYAAKVRLTAIAYIIPTPKVSLYLGGGIGGASLGELGSVTSPGSSYHVGAGLEVHLSAHVGIDTSFYMVIPGVDSVERHVEHLALTAAEARAEGGTGGPEASALPFEEPGLGDFVSPKNYELMVRFFVFL